MFCKECGKEVNEKAEVCLNCGCRPTIGHSYCQECGAETNEKQEICVKCGCKLKVANMEVKKENNQPDFLQYKIYYQIQFKKIYESNEVYKGTFNFFAWFFSFFWTLAKGCWVAAATWVIILIVDYSFLTAGWILFVYNIILGFRGTYIYYNASIKRKQKVL